jgi:hypothetical protein
MTQIERVSVFREFKASKSGILLCTDVAGKSLYEGFEGFMCWIFGKS